MNKAVPILVLLLAGCSTLTPEEREYNRVEWLETQFKPMVAACDASPSHSLVYDGPQNRRLRQKIEDRDFDDLRRLDAINIRCVDTDDLMRALR